jgi:hypothetical protein
MEAIYVSSALFGVEFWVASAIIKVAHDYSPHYLSLCFYRDCVCVCVCVCGATKTSLVSILSLGDRFFS